MYKKLLVTVTISFCIMYLTMFLNVDQASHIYFSLTRTYMALLMTSPMVVLMLLTMKSMYPNKRYNQVTLISSIAVFALALLGLRSQTPISDIQYMKAMIPHHSSAIMTSKHADLRDPEVKKLSESIIESQQREIEQMKTIIDRLE
jgi:uncharacterized protein (DUF305 family)